MNVCGAPEVTEITVIKVLQGLSSNCEVRVKAMIACLFISVGGASCVKLFHGYRPAFVGSSFHCFRLFYFDVTEE